MKELDKIQQINESRKDNILKAFLPSIEKAQRANHKYIRKEGSRYIYKENEGKEGKTNFGDDFKALNEKHINERNIHNEKHNLMQKEFNSIMGKHPNERSDKENERAKELFDKLKLSHKKENKMNDRHVSEKLNLAKKHNIKSPLDNME